MARKHFPPEAAILHFVAHPPSAVLHFVAQPPSAVVLSLKYPHTKKFSPCVCDFFGPFGAQKRESRRK